MGNIRYSVFCRRLYKAKSGYINSQASFVVRMFKSVKCSHFSDCDDDDGYAKLLFYGGSRAKKMLITGAIRSEIPPIDLSEPYRFFKLALSPTRIHQAAKEYNFSNPDQVDFDFFCQAATFLFKDFCTQKEEDLTKDLPDYYYEISTGNLRISEKDQNSSKITILLRQRNQCPLCKPNNPLIYEKDGHTINNYHFVALPPKKGIVNEKDLLIALCLKHYQEFLASPNDETMLVRLYSNIKEILAAHQITDEKTSTQSHEYCG